MKGPGRHFRHKGENKFYKQVKCRPGELNICEFYSRRGKAIGSIEIPTGNFLPQQKIKNRTGWIRKLVFAAGATLRYEVEFDNDRQMPNECRVQS